MSRTLAVRLDAMGDVLLTGPAIRSLASTSNGLTLLAGPRGADAASLLPGVDDIKIWACPWIEPTGPPVDKAEVLRLVEWVSGRFDRAVIFSSFHQDPLPVALLLRMAGVEKIAAISPDFPGALLDVRHRVASRIPESERALSLALAAGGRLPAGDEGELRIRGPLDEPVVAPPYVVLHPGTSVPARAWPGGHFAELARILAERGRRVVVTGSPEERMLARHVAGVHAVNLAGLTSLQQLAATLAGADVVVCGNTGAAHLAAAVGTPVVSLFAPTVPAAQWAPYGVPTVILGDQAAPCAGTRAVECPVPGHPCLASVAPLDVAESIAQLAPSLEPL